MKAAQFFGRGDIRVTDVPYPQPKDHEALVAIEWAGICGSDLHEYIIGPVSIPRGGKPHALTGENLPVTMGHEFCGRIISAPPSSGLSEGQAVMVDPRIYCNSCARCTSPGKNTNVCKSWGFHGLSGHGGGFPEAIAVDSKLCYPLPANVDLRLAALIEPLAVAWRAVNLAEVKDWSNQSVLILGGGPVGIAHIYVLRARGARKIYVSEPTSTRAKQNREIADEVINPIETKVADRCQELTKGEGVDVVFDCAGVPNALNDGMGALKHKGIYVNVAAWETGMTVPIGHLLLKELSIKGSLAYDDKDFRDTVDAFVAGKFKGVEKMITSRIHLDDIVTKGFEELVNRKDDSIKILVTTRREYL